MSSIQTSIQTFIQEIKRTYLKKGGRPGKTPQRWVGQTAPQEP